MDEARRELARVLGEGPCELTPLTGGCVGEVLRVDAAGHPPRVAKLDAAGTGGLDVEAAMLRTIRACAPEVLYSSPHVLLMEWRPGHTGVGDGAADEAAAALASLHAARDARFGYPAPTRIGGLVQPNPQRDSWLAFFAEARLLGPALAAHDEGRLDARAVALLERVASRLPELADEPPAPALLHGDLWSGNVLTTSDAFSAFIDPALYHGHPEVDLAFATMFGGFAERFFEAYAEHAASPGSRLLDDGFWRERKDLWNLYPLLVHVRLFGGSYVDQLVRAARRFG